MMNGNERGAMKRELANAQRRVVRLVAALADPKSLRDPKQWGYRFEELKTNLYVCKDRAAKLGLWQDERVYVARRGEYRAEVYRDGTAELRNLALHGTLATKRYSTPELGREWARRILGFGA